MLVFQASAAQPSYRHFIKCLSAAHMSYPNYINSEIRSEPNSIMKSHTESALGLCVWGSQNYRNQTTRLEKSWQKGWRTAMKKWMEYCITKGYPLSQKPSKQSLLIDITTTLWLDILASKTSKTLSAGNTISRASEKTLRPMSQAIMYAWAQKQSDISPMETCNPCLY